MNMSQRLLASAPRILQRERRGPIGIDICMEHIQMIQLCRKNGLLHIHAVATIEYSGERISVLTDLAQMKSLIGKALATHPFRNRDCVATIPPDYVKLKFITYQKDASQSDEEALAAALKERLGNDINTSVIDYVPIRPENINQSGRSALVAIADRENVMKFLQMLQHCGLKPAALEIGPVAVRRLVCALSSETNNDKLLVINFGTSQSYMTVLWGRRILMDREVDFGLRQVSDALAVALETSPEKATDLLVKYGVFRQPDADDSAGINAAERDDITRSISDIVGPIFSKLATEIRDLLVYTASETRGGAIEQIYLFGSMARISGTDCLMDKLLSIPVKTINPFFGFDVSDTAVPLGELEPLAGIAVATGMALRGLSDDA